jgi:hypothetical protein
MANKTARANPLLTSLSLKRRTQAKDYVANFLAPVIMTGKQSFGEYYEFDDGAFAKNPDNRKAADVPSRTIDIGASLQPFKCVEYGSRAGYTKRELDDFGGPENALQKAKMQAVTDADMLAHEVRVATQFTTSGNFASGHSETLAGSDIWDNASSDPFEQIITAKQKIKLATGYEPNRMVVSYDGFWGALANHADIKSRVQAQQKDTGFRAITPQLVGSLFDVDLRVAGAVYNSANEGQTVSRSFCWGDHALVFYAEESPAKDSYSLAYTFTYEDFVMRTYFENSTKKTWVDNSHDVDVKICGNAAGYLISNLLT